MPALRSLLVIAALCSLLSTAAAAGSTGSSQTQIKQGTALSPVDASYSGGVLEQLNTTNRTLNSSSAISARENLSARASCYPDGSNPPANISLNETATGTLPPDRYYIHDHRYYRALWSGDPDYPNLTRADRAEAENDTLAVLPSCTGDMLTREPSTVESRNQPVHRSFRTDIRRSAVPTNVASTRSGFWNRDAYVTFFSVAPSTVVHRDSGTERLVRPSGTIRALHDYRVLRVPDSIDDEYRFKNTTSTTTLYANGTEMDSSDAPNPELEYSGLNGTTELRLVTTISTNITDVDPYEFPRNWDVDEYEMTVTDSRTVTVENLSERNTVVEPGVAPSDRGDTTDEYRVGTVIPGSWQSVQFDDRYEVQSQWRFYTRSPPQDWTEWSENTTTPMRPLETHAVRAGSGPKVTVDRVQNSGSWQFVPSLEATYPMNATGNTTGNKTRTTLPPEIRINRSESFTTADRFTIRSTEPLRTGNFEIRGLVRGNSIEQPASSSPTPIREVNITSEVVDSTDNSTDLLVRVDPKAGFPIAAGNVTVDTGQSRVERSLSSTDEITVTVDQGEVSSALITYRPTQIWWEQGRAVPVRDTQERVAYEVDLPDPAAFINLAVVTLVTLLPAVLVLYGYDVWTRGQFVGWYNP